MSGILPNPIPGTELSEDQLLQCARIFVECFTAPPRGENWLISTAQEYLQREAAHGAWFWLAARADHSIAGFAVVMPAERCNIAADFPPDLSLRDMDYLSVVAVSPTDRTQGLGAQLVRRCVEHARARGCHALSARTRTDTVPIRRLLRRLGFRCLRRYESTIGGEQSEREIHVLPLTPALTEAAEAEWRDLRVYCLQVIALPDAMAEGLLVCGRSLLRGLRECRGGVDRAKEAWRWEGWRPVEEILPDLDAAWSALLQPGTLDLAGSLRCRPNESLQGMLAASAAALPELQSGIRFDAARSDFVLCANDHGTFLLVVRFQVKVAPELALGGPHQPLLADCLFELPDREDRGLLSLLRESPWGRALQALVNAEVRDLCERWVRERPIFDPLTGLAWKPEERFAPKTVHAFSIYGPGFSEAQVMSVHRIEEGQLETSTEATLAGGREGAVLRLGWSFSSALGFSAAETRRLLLVLSILQLHWWFMRFCRRHLYELSWLAVDPALPARTLECAVRNATAMAASTSRFLIDHKRIRAAIAPRDQLVFDDLEEKWRLREDLDLVREIREDLHEIAQVRAAMRSSHNQRLQSFALFVVAILQLFSLVSIATDYRTLMSGDEEPVRGLYSLGSLAEARWWHIWLPALIGGAALLLAGLPFVTAIGQTIHRNVSRVCLRHSRKQSGKKAG